MRAVPLAVLLSAACASSGAAQDALRGKRLYHDVGRLSGAGVSCVDCHGGVPGALHGIGKAAGNPAAIVYALGAIQQMTPLRGRLSEADMADLAAYLAAPAVPSPEPRLTTSGPAVSPYSAERLEFPAIAPGATSPPSTVRLANTGAIPLTLGAAPALAGPAAAEFAITATDCVAGAVLTTRQSCAIDIVFNPRGAAGARAASVGVTHDWVRGGVNVALIGQVAPPRRGRASPPLAR